MAEQFNIPEDGKETRLNVIRDLQLLDITFAITGITNGINVIQDIAIGLDKDTQERIRAGLLQIDIMLAIIDKTRASFTLMNTTAEQAGKHFQDKMDEILKGVNAVVEGMKK